MKMSSTIAYAINSLAFCRQSLGVLSNCFGCVYCLGQPRIIVLRCLPECRTEVIVLMMLAQFDNDFRVTVADLSTLTMALVRSLSLVWRHGEFLAGLAAFRRIHLSTLVPVTIWTGSLPTLSKSASSNTSCCKTVLNPNRHRPNTQASLSLPFVHDRTRRVK